MIFVILGFIGALLPGIPTTVFLILAAWASSRGWPQMDNWLLNHPKYGSTLRDWRANGTVPRKAKWLATIMMSISAGHHAVYNCACCGQSFYQYHHVGGRVFGCGYDS